MDKITVPLLEKSFTSVNTLAASWIRPSFAPEDILIFVFSRLLEELGSNLPDLTLREPIFLKVMLLIRFSDPLNITSELLSEEEVEPFIRFTVLPEILIVTFPLS